MIGGENVTTGYFGTGLYNERDNFTITRWYDPDFSDPAGKSWAHFSTVGASLYLLVQTQELSSKQFLCPSDDEAEEIDLYYATDQAYRLGDRIEDLGELNDFHSMVNLSYSYQDSWRHQRTKSALWGASYALVADTNNACAIETGEPNLQA